MTQPARITYVSQAPYFGGAERYLEMLIGGLDRTRFTPTVLYLEDPRTHDFVERLTKINVAVEPLKTVNASRSRRILRSMTAYHRAKSDLVHFNLTWPSKLRFPMLAAALSRIPYVTTDNLVSDTIPPSAKEKRARRWCTKFSRGTIAVSEQNRRVLDDLWGINPETVTVVRYGVDLATFDPKRHPSTTSNATRESLSLSPDRVLALTVARLHPQKGIDVLVEAAIQHQDALQNVCFVIAGHGEKREEFETQIRNAGIPEMFRFLGARNDIPELLAAADIFVLPSRFEGLPITVLEAMASGLPVISSAVSGTPEAVSHGVTGLLVPPGDSQALGTALVQVAHDQELRQQFGKAALERARSHFSAARMVQETQAVYERVLGTPRIE